MPDPADCTTAVDPGYTAGTFDLFMTPEGGDEFDVGTISTGAFNQEIELLEHRRGKDNALDFIIKLSTDYIVDFTADQLTARNIGMLLNEDPVTVGADCEIPLRADRCVKHYGMRLVHDFPCADRSLEIWFWLAMIAEPFTVPFEPGAWSTLPGRIRSLFCPEHPTQPFGKLVFSGVCPVS